MYRQFGSGKCSICGSPGTTKSSCPLNPNAKNPKPEKHPLALKLSKQKKSRPKVTTSAATVSKDTAATDTKSKAATVSKVQPITISSKIYFKREKNVAKKVL